MLKIIAKLNVAVCPQFMSAVPSLEQALTEHPAAGVLVHPREEILLDDVLVDDAARISRGSVGTVVEAPASFLLDDEVVVNWPELGTIIHKLEALALVEPAAAVAA